MKVEKPRKGSVVIFFTKDAIKTVNYLLVRYNHTSIYSPKFSMLFKHCTKGTMPSDTSS